MTTLIRVEAHCPSNIEVVVKRHRKSDPVLVDSKPVVLQDGETYDDYVYDDQAVLVYERPKT